MLRSTVVAKNLEVMSKEEVSRDQIIRGLFRSAVGIHEFGKIKTQKLREPAIKSGPGCSA